MAIIARFTILLVSLLLLALPSHANSSTAKPTANGQNFDQLYRNAELEMSRLNIEKARRLYQEIDKLSGTVSSDKQGKGKKARIMLKSYLPLHPVSQQCNDLYKQGDVLTRAKNPHDALTVFTDLANRYPKFEWAQTAMAALYMRLNDTESAARCARRALSINPNFLQAWMIMIHDAQMHNDLDGEIDAAARALQLDPTNNAVRSLLNSLLMEKRKQLPD
jgi:outer membrane protein assembly factor BamD (BamD/ComL family)